MAKRRKVAAPSAADLDRIEEEFRRETRAKPNPGIAPISQVSAETARVQPIAAAEERVQRAHDAADAARYRTAREDGRFIEKVPTESVQPDVLVRDRTVIDPEEMAELKASITANGLRLPIEIFARREGRRPYALLSGFRRLRAVKELFEETGDDRFKTIAALVRDPEALGGGFAAMVEENEIRSSLSHYERGRIAVIAAQRGAFDDAEAAVAQLFKAASKAKRSKIRSFAVIFEELGDLLQHAEGLKERDGLRLATALRSGGADQLRAALDANRTETAAQEWAVLSPVVDALEKGAEPARTGRPKKTGAEVLAQMDLSNGVRLKGERAPQGYVIRLQGRVVDDTVMQEIMTQLGETLSQKSGE